MQLQAGSQLGQYEILSRLGAGGMGEVYRARDTKLGREVAIKLLLDELAADPERLARFEREARVLASLNHPNVATLHGFETIGDTSFLVMELVGGGTLEDRIAQGPIPIGEALTIFREIARGLEAAHEKGVAHRDLKPANIKLGPDGGVKILDFGLAKAATEPDGGVLVTDTPTQLLTREGSSMGTPAYMSPEQASGAPTSAATDVWSFGVCLFEAVTGSRPFASTDVTELLRDVLSAEPDWSTLPPDTPPQVRKLLRRTLRKNPRQRLRHIGDARLELEDALDPEDAAPEPPTPTSRSSLLMVAALVAVALVAAAATWLFTGRGTSSRDGGSAPQAVHFTIGSADGSPLRALGGVVISPNGRRVVYSGGSQESEGLVVGGDLTDEPLRVRPIDAFDDSTRTLAGTEGALYPFFSPDSEWVGFFRGGGGVRTLYRVNVASGSVLPITTDPRPGYQADWDEDGTLVLGGQRDGLKRVEVATGALGDFVTQLDAAEGDVAHVNPEILPHGRGIVFTALRGPESPSRVRVWDARSGETRTVLPRGGNARYLASGHLLYALDENLLLVGFDLETLATVGETRVIAQGVATSRVSGGYIGKAYFDVSDDGTLVYLPGSAEEPQIFSLVSIRPDGTEEDELVQGDVQHPQISRDGRRWLARTSRSELVLFDEGSPLPKRFPTEIPLAAPPLLIDDSTALYGNANLTAGARLFRLDLTSGISSPLDRQHLERRLPVALDAARGEVIALAVTIEDDGAIGSDLVVGDLAGTAPSRELITGPDLVTGARLSPNSDRLAYSILSDPITLVSTLYVSDYPNLERRVPISETMVDNGYAWGPDGRLWFVDRPDRTMRVVSFSPPPELRVSSIDEAFSLTPPFWPERGFAVAPDGRLLMVRSAGEGGDVSGPSGRLRVIVGWARGQGLQAGSRQ